MSPLEARRAVGQPDIVDMARAAVKDDRLSTGALYRDLADEIERLRIALRAVRACTDQSWANQIIADALRETP